MRISTNEFENTVTDKLESVGVKRRHALLISAAIMDAEKSGIVSHGLARLPTYLAQLKTGIL